MPSKFQTTPNSQQMKRKENKIILINKTFQDNKFDEKAIRVSTVDRYQAGHDMRMPIMAMAMANIVSLR
jgi:hypothetical protein